MNEKLNEAQYTVSIDNLETTDAETLSQMLSLAGQAEQPVATEMPMDPMAEPAPVMDYEPTIPSTMDGPGFEAAEVDSMPADEFPSPVEEPTVDDMGYGAPVDDTPVVDAEEDVVLPAEETEIMGESVEGEEGLAEDVLVPSSEKAEKEDPTKADKEIPQGKWDFYFNIFEDIYQQCQGNRDDIINKIYALRDDMGNLSDKEVEYIEDHFDELFNAVKKDSGEDKYEYSPEEEEELKRDVEFEKMRDAKDIAGEYKYDEPVDECGSTKVTEEMDAEIAETLRLAGVQLDEVSEEIALAGKKDLPMPPVGKANPAAKEDAKAQEPNYQEPATEKVMGYEATLGFENPANVGLGICVKETVNKDKIASILETARHMYAKKDSSEWLALDRRYVEKLLKEGVGYTNASKMLLKAKAGK